jgi:hypothetical protein
MQQSFKFKLKLQSHLFLYHSCNVLSIFLNIRFCKVSFKNRQKQKKAKIKVSLFSQKDLSKIKAQQMPKNWGLIFFKQ